MLASAGGFCCFVGFVPCLIILVSQTAAECSRAAVSCCRLVRKVKTLLFTKLFAGMISGALKEGGENATLSLTGVGGSAGPSGSAAPQTPGHAQSQAQGQRQTQGQQASGSGRAGIAPLDVSDEAMALAQQGQGAGHTPQTHTQTHAAHAPGQPHTPAQPHDSASASASASHAHGHGPAVRPSPSPLSATGQCLFVPLLVPE